MNFICTKKIKYKNTPRNNKKKAVARKTNFFCDSPIKFTKKT